MEKDNTVLTIQCLPDEIISLILINNEPREIINFSLTCKQFHDSVCNNDYLWKMKYSEKVPRVMLKVIKDHCDSKWRKEFIHLCKVRKKVYSELLSMSPKFYWRFNTVSLEDVRPFFLIATEHSLNYYYIIYMLQDIIKKGKDYLDNFICSKPLYTMTVMFYSKIVLRHLVQTYLAIQWVQLHMKHKLTPEKVITFFLQWIDPTRIYDLDEIENRIQGLVKKVENILKEQSKNAKTTPVQVYTEKQVLQAISQVIYKHERFSVAFNVKTNNLDVARVIKDSHGNIFTFGAIYQAIAERFGINCELKVFPNHLFLDWRNNEEPNKPLYTIDLLTGELKPKKQCPFARTSGFSDTKYCPDSLLQYIYSSYMKSKAPIKNCQTQNAIHLLDFLGTCESKHNPYKNFLFYLVENANSPAMNTKLNLKYMDESHLQMILSLSTLNEPPQEVYQNVVVKEARTADVAIFAVGMTCYHKLYHYMCIIRDWEANGMHLPLRSEEHLQHGKNQPFYRVIAGDQSERFIAHENLTLVNSPYRNRLLEDNIASEFTHFEGFYYVPNDEKLAEYPNDIVVAEAFKKRCTVN
ncbi:unnamed protein product, partial [Brenthis ino]